MGRGAHRPSRDSRDRFYSLDLPDEPEAAGDAEELGSEKNEGDISWLFGVQTLISFASSVTS